MMTTKEKQEKILKAFNLKEGDRVMFKLYGETYTITYNKEDERYVVVGCNGVENYFNSLINFEFEKIEHKKKIGDLKCGELFCINCPMFCINCSGFEGTIFEELERTKVSTNMRESIYQAIKAEIDKEV